MNQTTANARCFYGDGGREMGQGLNQTTKDSNRNWNSEGKNFAFKNNTWLFFTYVFDEGNSMRV